MHGIEVWGPLRRSAAAALRQATVLLANSAHTERRARDRTPGLPPVRVVGLALPDEPARGRADEESLAPAPQGFFLTVGRMHPAERYKGHELILDALAGLRREGTPAPCVFAGDGADRPRLESRARELGIGDLVTFTGAVSDTTREALYARCRALVLPSTGEGFGLVYLEAMRAGRACVAARWGAAEEIVVPDVTGVLVDTERAEDLQGALARLHRDEAWSETLGTAGRRRFEERFTESRFRSRFEPEIERLVAGGEP
jgi:phosphatidylinositol alpha-1,6-mannosyltransferase